MADPTWDEIFERAMQLRDESKFEEAIRLLEGIAYDVDKRARLAVVNAQLGNIYAFELEAPEKGEVYFRKAVQAQPHSELASLGLFHSLTKQHKLPEAMAEMRRYVSAYPSEEYEQIRKELWENVRRATEEDRKE